MGSYNRPNRPADQIASISRTLERLGIDPAKVAHFLGTADLASAVTACHACPASEVCQDRLANAPSGQQTTPDFCPNGSLFAALDEANRFHSYHDGNPSGRLH